MLLPRPVAFATLTLLAAAPLCAQKLIADYPLLTDLLDKTNNNGPVALSGNPTPPSPPANGVCQNGIYRLSPNGQNVQTPIINGIDTTDFQIDVDFLVNGMPAGNPGAPVLMAGNGWRWIGIYMQPGGTVGLKYNNSNFAWSTMQLTTGRWYSGVIRFETGTVRLYIDGDKVLDANIGVLNTGSNENFTTNDFSNGRAFNGCIRNLRIWNDAQMDAGLVTRFPHACGGLTIADSGTPNIGGGIKLALGGPNAAAGGYLIGLTGVQFPLCPAAPCVIGTNPLVTLGGPGLSGSIPNSRSLIGVAIFFQGITVVPTGGCFLLALTDTIKVTVGQ